MHASYIKPINHTSLKLHFKELVFYYKRAHKFLACIAKSYILNILPVVFQTEEILDLAMGCLVKN